MQGIFIDERLERRRLRQYLDVTNSGRFFPPLLKAIISLSITHWTHIILLETLLGMEVSKHTYTSIHSKINFKMWSSLRTALAKWPKHAYSNKRLILPVTLQHHDLENHRYSPFLPTLDCSQMWIFDEKRFVIRKTLNKNQVVGEPSLQLKRFQ